jgi:hypothetical protein
MSKALLDNAFAPITFSFGFVRSPFQQFADAFVSWWTGIFSDAPERIEFTRFSASLPAALTRLQPLTTPQDSYLIIETRSDWTAIFSNGLRVNDVHSPVSYLPTVLKCRGLEVTCVPDRSRKAGKDGLQIWGAVTFSLYGAEGTDWLNRIRHIGVANDVGGWEFSAEGEIQPYELVENYQRRKLVERFTPEMLESYCAGLGIALFDADFYGGQCLLAHTKRTTRPGPAMSIAEARCHLYL